MIITILEAYVAPEKSGALEQAYQVAIAELEPGITQTLLFSKNRPGEFPVLNRAKMICVETRKEQSAHQNPG